MYKDRMLSNLSSAAEIKPKLLGFTGVSAFSYVCEM